MLTLDTGIKNVKNVNRYNFGAGSIDALKYILDFQRQNAIKHQKSDQIVFLVVEYFKNFAPLKQTLFFNAKDILLFISVKDEPKTTDIDTLVMHLRSIGSDSPAAIVAVGGGITMDYSKAISNLLGNYGRAEDYQGWDLLKSPGIFKIGIPTISGTGSEATRTCVMTNPKTGLKLGMNSDFTVFDHIIMDPMLTRSVPRAQYFYTGMDAYVHCVEALAGSYRNAIGDAYSSSSISLCKEVFLSDDMQSDANREKLMVASYLGGCSIATSYVGLIHPLSAGLSVVLGVHHCIANCIVMRAMEEFYPEAYEEFWRMVSRQKIEIPLGICRNLDDSKFEALYSASIIHEKPLTNALGVDFKEILTPEKIVKLYKTM